MGRGMGMGRGAANFPYPKWVWSPAGGWWCEPKNGSRNTMIAAEVFSTNARSGLSAHRKICTGNTVAGEAGPALRVDLMAAVHAWVEGQSFASAWALCDGEVFEGELVRQGRPWDT